MTTSIRATIKGDSLIAQHEHYVVRIEVVPPEVRDSENGPIRAVVRMTTDLPALTLGMFSGRQAAATAVRTSGATSNFPRVLN